MGHPLKEITLIDGDANSIKADSHQSNPNYIIAFLPFKWRDTYYKFNKEEVSKIREEAVKTDDFIIVTNDAVNITIRNTKSQSVDIAEAHLLSGDINYSSAVAPGDYAFIWLFNDIVNYQKVYNSLINKSFIKKPNNNKKDSGEGTSINYENSGLKFFGKVNSVRQVLEVDPSTGRKIYRHIVTMMGFSEFLTQIYFNEYLSNISPNLNAVDASMAFFINLNKQAVDLFKSSGASRLEIIKSINFLIDIFLGVGPDDKAKKVKNAQTINNKQQLQQTPNDAFLIPSTVANMFGINKTKSKSKNFMYVDILQKVFGLQKYSSDKMFPSNAKIDAQDINYYECATLKGGNLMNLLNFNNINFWSLLLHFINPVLNELYTALKFVPEKGIMPTLTLRQMPFSSEKILDKTFIKGSKKIEEKDVTLFSDLPRWKISNNYPIFNYNIGVTDAERFNFILTYTNNITGNNAQESLKTQILFDNFRLDLGDIFRNGPRIHATSSDTDPHFEKSSNDVPQSNNQGVTDNQNAPKVDITNISEWAELIGDFFVNGHLRMNGTITVAGIQAPIAVGDNLEFDNKLFHIEGITHSFSIDIAKGTKRFLTELALSRGHYIDKSKGKERLVFVTSQNRLREGQIDELLPGVTDEERILFAGDNNSNENLKAPSDEQKVDLSKTINKTKPTAS